MQKGNEDYHRHAVVFDGHRNDVDADDSGNAQVKIFTRDNRVHPQSCLRIRRPVRGSQQLLTTENILHPNIAYVHVLATFLQNIISTKMFYVSLKCYVE